MRWERVSMPALVACGLAAPAALAQRGMGKSAGVARQAAKPGIVSLSGKAIGADTGPRENTTGRAFLLEPHPVIPMMATPRSRQPTHIFLLLLPFSYGEPELGQGRVVLRQGSVVIRLRIQQRRLGVQDVYNSTPAQIIFLALYP